MEGAPDPGPYQDLCPCGCGLPDNSCWALYGCDSDWRCESGSCPADKLRQEQES